MAVGVVFFPWKIKTVRYTSCLPEWRR